MNARTGTFLAVCVAGQIAAPAYANLTVTSPLNSGPGTLRDRVAVALPGDTIDFAVKGPIVLSSSITIGKLITIAGPGPALLTVSGGNVDRIFITTVDGIFIYGLTLQNGFAAGPDGPDGALGQNGFPGIGASGGAILNSGILVVSNCWFKGNIAQGGKGGRGGDNLLGAAFTCGTGGAGGDAGGGAIASSKDVTVLRCTFSNNKALGGAGGVGGTNYNFIVVETGGTGGNGGTASGGAFFSPFPVFTSCTFSGNLALGGAGSRGGDTAAAAAGGAGGNAGDGTCGGLNVGSFGSTTVSCTIVSNSAVGGDGGAGGAGSVTGASGNTGMGSAGGFCSGYSATCFADKIVNTILAKNYASTIYTNASALFNDKGFNYLGDDIRMGPCIGSLTRMGTVASPLDPQLGPLLQNGGGLPTHAPLNGSPVIDWGHSSGTTTDERRAPRPYGSAVPQSFGDGSDVGAFEFGSTPLGMSINNGTNVVVSWPAYYGDFQLYSTFDLTASNPWTLVPDMPVVVEDQFTVTNAPLGTMRFYRLMSNH